MKRETRKALNQMVKDLNSRFPSRDLGFKRVITLELVKDTLEVHETIYKDAKDAKDKPKIESTAVIAHLLTPENKTHYTWEDMLTAGLSCAGLPLYIFDIHQRDVEDQFKKRVEEKGKLGEIAKNLQSQVVDD